MPNDLSNVINQIKKDIIAKANETKEKANKEFFPILEKEITKCWVSAITNYYQDYDQDYYKRKYDLYDMLRTRVDSDGISIKVSSDYLQEHRVDNEYIFHLMFEEGWHGGATHGVDPWGNEHPNPGTPYWRSKRFINKEGERSYKNWGRRAYLSLISPDRDFQNQLDSISEDMGDKYVEIFKKYWSR